MLDQINISRNDLSWSDKSLCQARAKFARDYYDEALARAAHDIAYHEGKQREENDRVAQRNRWVNELKASLGVIK